MDPIESYLSDQENRIEEEKARIKAEAEAKIQAIFQARENRLLDMGCRFDRIAMAYSYGELVAPVAMVKVAPDDMFEKICVAIQGAVDAEKTEKAAEAERIAKITAEQKKSIFVSRKRQIVSRKSRIVLPQNRPKNARDWPLRQKEFKTRRTGLPGRRKPLKTQS